MTSIRDEVRAKIFSSDKRRFKKEVIDLFGAQVEIRQPTLGTILDAQTGGDRKRSLMFMLVNYCFVPGTDEHVFEETDLEGLMAMPFGEDFMRVQKAVAQMTDVNILVDEATGE
jgi:hypothetical protein